MGLFGKHTLAQDLAKTSSRDVNHWSLALHSGVLQSRLFRDERPELVQVHSWLVEVRVVRIHFYKRDRRLLLIGCFGLVTSRVSVWPSRAVNFSFMGLIRTWPTRSFSLSSTSSGW